MNTEPRNEDQKNSAELFADMDKEFWNMKKEEADLQFKFDEDIKKTQTAEETGIETEETKVS